MEKTKGEEKERYGEEKLFCFQTGVDCRSTLCYNTFSLNRTPFHLGFRAWTAQYQRHKSGWGDTS